MMMLRKCCSHPYLLSQPIGVLDLCIIYYECGLYGLTYLFIAVFADPETGYCLINEELVNSSGKMLLLDAMLKELKLRGHKVSKRNVITAIISFN